MRTTRTLASLLLAAYLGLASVGAQGAVLCVGEDGHLAIEFGCSGDSCSTSDTPDLALSTSSQCGSCVDTPLLNDLARSTPHSDRSTSASAPLDREETAPFAIQPTASMLLPHDATPPPTLSLILRTNALLI